MKQVQKGSGHMLTALSQNNTFSGGDFIDIVGVTGSIPVAPTIRPSEKIEIIASDPIGCEVPVRFSEPWSRFLLQGYPGDEVYYRPFVGGFVRHPLFPARSGSRRAG